MATNLQERTHINEPQQCQEYADVASRVATEKKPVVVLRNGAELVAIVALEHLEILEDALAMEEAQRILRTVDLRKLARESPPPQSWFDSDEPKPF